MHLRTTCKPSHLRRDSQHIQPLPQPDALCRFTSRWLLAVSILLLGIVSAKPLLSQAVSATVVGTVTDKTGATIGHARVSIVDLATSTPHQAITNDSGNFTMPDLQPGAYSISVEAPGFRRETRTSVDVVVNTTSRIDFELVPGAVTDTITVDTSAPLLQTDRADVSTKLEAEKMENLPIGVNRNFQSLLNLVPGTTPASFQHSQFFNAQSSLQTEVNGTPRMGNSYQIEGIDDDERTGLLQIMIPPADAIETVDVSTNNFEAELGRAIGAVTNVTLKSGTNKFHGSASEYLQNSDLNARSYFASSVGHLAYNYFGGNFSGPIFKDKLFFYGDFFRTADHEANANTMTIPFKKYYTCNGAGFIDLSDGLSTNSKGQVVGQIYDPATGDASGNNRTPFANNQIPCGRVNPVSAKILSLLPAPNQNLGTLAAPNNNYFATLPFQKASNTYDAKIDYQLSPKDHLSYRYGYQSSHVFQAPVFGSAGGGPANGAFAGTGIQNAYSTGINYDRAFSSTLLTEVRFGIAHYKSNAQPTDYGSNDATAIGIPGVNINTFTSGQATININNFTAPTIGYSASVPWVRAEANIDLVNHWTKIIGNHTIKFGGDLRRIRDELLQDQTFGPRGVYTFAEGQTSAVNSSGNVNFANSMASFLLDMPNTGGRDLNTFTPDLRAWWIFSFIGDKWQASSKLTLDYGVRWELYPPMTPAKAGGFSNYNPATNSLVLAGIGSNPSDLGLKNRYNFFAPRTGFAYRATEATVIRGGFGISYAPFPDNTYAYNFPVRANNAYTANNTYTPTVLADQVTPATFQNGFPAPVPVAIPSNGIISIVPGTTLNSSSFTYIPQNYYNPYVESWNLAVQQALPGQFSLQISYVGNHGVHIATSQDINLPTTFGGGTTSRPEYTAIVNGAQEKRSASTTQQFLGNSSNFQSLQIQLTRRFIKGLSSSSAFTWGKGLGYQNADDGGLQFFQQPRRNYGPNDYDRRLNYEQSITYELPFGPGKRFLHEGLLARTIGGWKLSGILSVVSGSPFTVTANGNTLNTPGETQTANLVGPYRVLHGIGAAHPWFDPTAFAQPAGCPAPTGSACTPIAGVTVGNLGRNTFYGPGFIQDNLSVFKTFGVFERATLDIRADVFQLSNTPQFANPTAGSSPPNASLTSSTFGQITSVLGSGTGANGIGGGRSMQLAAIIKF